ncbi:MAG: HAD family hydrolase [Halobacteriaceae archaeon]
MDDYGAVVFDLDGTLLRLAVDWDAVDSAVQSLIREAGGDPAGCRVWELLDDAAALGVVGDVEAVVSEHERAGVDSSRRLPLADAVHDLSVPVGVCSLNCEQAVREALSHHGLLDAVDAVVGRDSVPGRKPDPEPLLRTIEELAVAPGRVLFVGDSESDQLTADRAGVTFSYVDEVTETTVAVDAEDVLDRR